MLILMTQIRLQFLHMSWQLSWLDWIVAFDHLFNYFFLSKCNEFHSEKCISKCFLQNGSHASMCWWPFCAQCQYLKLELSSLVVHALWNPNICLPIKNGLVTWNIVVISSENQSKFIQERITKVEQHFGELCTNIAAFSRKLGKLRDKGKFWWYLFPS